MNVYLVFIVVILVIHYLLDLFADILNVRNCSEQLPEEFRHVYDVQKYSRSQQYLKDHTRLDTVVNSIHTLITLAFILLGGFRLMDRTAHGAGWGMIGTGLLFGGILLILSQLMNLPPPSTAPSSSKENTVSTKPLRKPSSSTSSNRWRWPLSSARRFSR